MPGLESGTGVAGPDDGVGVLAVGASPSMNNQFMSSKMEVS